MAFCASQSRRIVASEIEKSNSLRPVSLLVIQGLKQALTAMHGNVSLAFILEDQTRRAGTTAGFILPGGLRDLRTGHGRCVELSAMPDLVNRCR